MKVFYDKQTMKVLTNPIDDESLVDGEIMETVIFLSKQNNIPTSRVKWKETS